MKKITSLFLIMSFQFIIAQHHPGGVTGVETWYYPTENDLELSQFPNYSETDIELSNCGQMNNRLMNFNPSFETEKLCLEYKTPWENSNNRSLFFVGDHKNTVKPYSHFYTAWRDDIGLLSIKPPFVEFFINLNSTAVSGLEISEEYVPNDLGVINYYHLNNYNIDRKFRSYGQTGETSVFIGKKGQLSGSGASSIDDGYFSGNFSEAISFTRDLSKNERNRVESYLAVKYGISLKANDSYRSSNNIKIWNQDNFNSFPKRVFGLGKDEISNLRQYQSHSIHDPNFLIAAIEELEENNTIKQENISIEDNHFLVFGDNGESAGLSPTNDKGFQFWKRVWLAQRTGTTVDTLPIYFQIELTPEIQEILLSDQGLDFWLLKDNDADHSEISDFSGEHIEYYPAVIDLLAGTATFENVYFDTDSSTFDQFTFGVGSEMVVQVTEYKCLENRFVPLLVTVSGGTPIYTIEMFQGTNLIASATTGDQEYIFWEAAQQGETYSIKVTDSNGIIATTDITVNAWDFSLDLGPDQDIVSGQNIILDAGVNIPDVNAAYQWYKDNELLDNTLSTLTVIEPGVYRVVVTSEDLTCQLEDEIVISPKDFRVLITTETHCFKLFNSINIDISGGQPNFTTILTQIDVDPITSTTHIHEGDLEISDLSYGEYIIEITDTWGATYQEAISLFYEDINLDIYSQLLDYCEPNVDCLDENALPAALFSPPEGLGFSLDASLGITQPNITYEWFFDGISVQTNPLIAFESIPDGTTCNQETKGKTIKAVATNTITNCNVEQTFRVFGYCLAGGIQDPNTPPPAANATSAPDDTNQLSALDAVVYPNPNKHNSVFIFEVFSTEVFSGVVEIFTLDGKALVAKPIKDQKRYALPFNLRTTGTYLIRATTEDGTVITKRVIIE